MLALQLTRRYSRDEILALYLNQTYYGNLAYGIEAASRAYFGKGAADLTLAECAMLAGLPQAPSLTNPLTDPEAAKARQRVVLDLMTRQGYITQAQADRAHAETLDFAATPFRSRRRTSSPPSGRSSSATTRTRSTRAACR